MNVEVIKEKEGQFNSYHLYVIKVKNEETRLKLFNYLKGNNIFCQVHYIPVYWHPYYRKLGYKKEQLPTEEEIIDRAVKSNFDLRTLKIKNQLDDEFAAIDRGSYWPTIAAFGDYSFAGNSDNWNFQNYRSSTIGISFSMNIFQGSRTKHKVQQDEITGQIGRAHV